jgi:hypothetical protein
MRFIFANIRKISKKNQPITAHWQNRGFSARWRDSGFVLHLSSQKHFVQKPRLRKCAKRWRKWQNDTATFERQAKT